jgi:small subunit ribosomal protein S4
MHGPKEKRERALGVRLGLKGDRALSPKSAMMRKPYRPGAHGPKSRPRQLSEFGTQLREKSKVKLMYGIDDKNLNRIFAMAVASKGALGLAVMETLESRLDNIVYRLGFTTTRAAARQLVGHGHITVNGRKVTSPGYAVKVGSTVAAKVESAAKTTFAQRREILKKFEAPSWLHLDGEKLEGKVLSLPKDTEVPFEINLLVESFSK